MSKTLAKKDVVVIGFGWTGAIIAKELTEAGLNVLALERGPMRDTDPDGVYPQTMDELTYNSRKKLFVDVSKETVTIRHTSSDTALPNRQLGAFLPGTGVGGAGRACTFAWTPWSCACAATMKSAMARSSYPRA